MIFKYKTIEISRYVKLDINLIRAHQKSIIENANLLSNGTKIHDELIDDELIELVPETIAEGRLISNEASDQEFNYDPVRDIYISSTSPSIDFYLDGTNKKNIYLNTIPNISSLAVPNIIFEDYVLTGVEVFGQTTIPSGTPIAEIQDVSTVTPTSIYTVTAPITADTFNITDLTIFVAEGTRLAVNMLNFGVDNPVIRIYFKKYYDPNA